MDLKRKKWFRKVTCAIIEKDDKVLAAQRSKNMSLPLKWEFPGGKIEGEETPEECISREIKEEINVDIDVIEKLHPYTHEFDTGGIEITPFICRIRGGEMKLSEHQRIIWDRPQKLASLDWAEADAHIYRDYMRYLDSRDHGEMDTL